MNSMNVSRQDDLNSKPVQDQLSSVSIVMPTYEGARYLEQLLPVLQAQDYPSPVEIVAIDSESSDGTVELLRNYGASVTVIPKQQFGHGYSRNLGVRKAQHPAIVFMSQDALPIGNDWLRRLSEPLSESRIGAVYARQIARADATPLEVFFHEHMYPPLSTHYALTPGVPVTLDRIFFSNVCSAARRDVCLAHPFDETLIMSEDQAFAKSLLMAGYQTFYNAEVQVIHSHHYDLKTLFRRNFDSAYSLRGISDDTWLHTIRKALEFIGGEVAYVVRKGRWGWLAAIPAYESARIVGRLLGKYADHLPRTWRRTLSLHSGYWTREVSNPR